MKIASLAAVAAIAFALSAPAFAADSGNGSQKVMGDDEGMAALGMDISGAGTTSDSVHKWWATQKAEDQASLTAKCKDATAPGSTAPASVMAFCKNSM